MPRKPRPDVTPVGTPEPNRTDLMERRTQPLTSVPTGQPYGHHKAEEDFVRQAPMQAVGAPAAAGGDGLDVLRAAPAPNVAPLTAPSQRPNEPLTAGLRGGPGPGPEVLGIQPRRTRYADVFAGLAASSDDPAWGDLADFARRLGQ